MNTIKKIRDWIESQRAFLPTVGYSTQVAEEYIPVQNFMNSLLCFLDTLQEPEETHTLREWQEILANNPEMMAEFERQTPPEPIRGSILQEPEVDLDEEINRFWDSCIKHKNERGGNVIWSNKIEVEVLARHFYELGKNAK